MKPAVPIYSLELAHKALALVRPILEDLVEARSRLDRFLEGLSFPADPEGGEDSLEFLDSLAELYGEVEGFRRELEDLGLSVLDERQGVVVFLSSLRERPISLFSWRLGEAAIQKMLDWPFRPGGWEDREDLSITQEAFPPSWAAKNLEDILNPQIWDRFLGEA